jgi:AsmA protein
MSKTIKWIMIIGLGLVLLVFLAILIVPLTIDVERYKPQIEAQVTKATGRPFKLGGELKPSLFPWVGVAVADLHLGNPSGFIEKDFVSVEEFEVRVRLLPLLSRNVEIKRFVMKGPRILLERQKDGRGNWEGLGETKTEKTTKPKQPAEGKPETSEGLPIQTLAVGEFSIVDGNILWVDHSTNTRKEIKDFNVTLADVSFDKPIRVDLRAMVDEHILALRGLVGPVGREPGKGELPLDLAVTLAETVTMKVKGRVENLAGSTQMNLAMNIESFSPRQLLGKIQKPLPFEPKDSKVFNTVALALKLSGSPQNVTVSDGKLTLDDSQIGFHARVKDFEKPDLIFDLNLDRIDLDRYLPAPGKDEKLAIEKEKSAGEQPKKTDYEPLRSLVLDAGIKVGELKAKNIHMQNIVLKTTADNGVIRVDPFNLDLYRGRMDVNGTVDVRQDTPRTAMKLILHETQVGPFVLDFLQKELIDGTLNADIDMQLKGDQSEQILRTLNGKGNLHFNDGAIVGIDLANIVRNVQAKLTLADKPSEKPRTDFSELLVPFSITEGLFKTDGIALNSPLLRLLITGTADLAKETIDMKVVPKLVATLVGQGDTKERSGVMVPVNITGSFTEPKFKPDLKSLIGQEFPDKQDIDKRIPPKEKIKEDLEKQAQELIKGLPFGK